MTEYLAVIFGGVVLVVTAFLILRSPGKKRSLPNKAARDAEAPLAVSYSAGTGDISTVEAIPESPSIAKATPVEEEMTPSAAAPNPDAEETPGEEPVNTTEGDGVSMFFSQTTDEMAQDQTNEETDEQAGDSHQNTGDKPAKSVSSVFDMFTEEIFEESEASKLAAKLDDPNMNDILSEARGLMGLFRTGK